MSSDERIRLAGIEQYNRLPRLDAVGKPILQSILAMARAASASGLEPP
jgi:hypothetical protein